MQKILVTGGCGYIGVHTIVDLVQNGYDVILRPYYVAIQALTRKNSDLFFNSIAAEVREPAKRILEMIWQPCQTFRRKFGSRPELWRV